MGDSSDSRDKHVNETVQQEEKKKCENWFVKNQQGFRIKLETQTNKTTSIFFGMSALSQVALYKFKMHSDHTVGLPYVCLLSLLHNFSCFSRFFFSQICFANNLSKLKIDCMILRRFVAENDWFILML